MRPAGIYAGARRARCEQLGARCEALATGIVGWLLLQGWRAPGASGGEDQQRT